MTESYKAEEMPPGDLDWESFISVLGEANRSLKDFNGILRGLPNPEILLSSFTTQEAVLSSSIEGTQADLEDVLEYEADPGEEEDIEKQKDIEEVINYRHALKLAEKRLGERSLNLNLIKKIHLVLLDSVRGKDKRRDKFRREQVWIGKGASKDRARYVSPEWNEVEPLMDNFEKYIHQEEKDPLVQLAIIHGQFEVIHPFLDGNGRVGRILVPLFLFEKEVLTRPMFYISEYLEANRNEYYDRLLAISEEGNWNGWIRFFLAAIREQARANRLKAEKILNLYDRMKGTITELTGSKYTIQALDALFERVFFTTSGFKEISEIPRSSTKRIIKLLREEEIIQTIREGSGRQPAIYAFPELFSIVEGEE